MKLKIFLLSMLLMCAGYLFIHILAKISYDNIINVNKFRAQNLKIKGRTLRYEMFETKAFGSYIQTYYNEISSTFGVKNTSQNETKDVENEEVFDETELSESTLLRLKELLQCDQRKLRSITFLRGKYWVLQNFQTAEERNIECHSTLTFATHGDFTFMPNLEILVQRWNAPISFALHAPGYDMETTVNSIRYVRDCSPVQDLIRKWVSFHVYYPVHHMPSSIPDVSTTFNCSDDIPYILKNNTITYKKNASLMYPLNVGRNIARDASVTHYYLMLDVELYPTPNLAARFLNMIARNHTLADGNWNKVFVLPPFEIEPDQTTAQMFHTPPKNVSDVFQHPWDVPKRYPIKMFTGCLYRVKIPDNKTQLLPMLKSRKAIKFHELTCKPCHSIPEYDKWLQQGQTTNLEITATGKRVGKYKSWEPKFISTHSEPYVDDRLVWEGMRDRMTMTYVLCVMDYDFLVLSNAFLVHHPGIKTKKPEAARYKFMTKQSKFIDKVLKKELNVLYSTRDDCVL